MESEIAQLKKEIEQLKEENKKWEQMAIKLRSRYVPDIEEYQETLVVKIDEDADNFYLTFSCSNNPKMKDKKNSKDGKTFYIKNLPSAEFFLAFARPVYRYLFNEGAKKISSKKYSIPKIRGKCKLTARSLIFSLRTHFEDLKDSTMWHSQYDKVEDRFPAYVESMKRTSNFWNSEEGYDLLPISCDNILDIYDSDSDSDSDSDGDSEYKNYDDYIYYRVKESKEHIEMIEKYNK